MITDEASFQLVALGMAFVVSLGCSVHWGQVGKGYKSTKVFSKGLIEFEYIIYAAVARPSDSLLKQPCMRDFRKPDCLKRQ